MPRATRTKAFWPVFVGETAAFSGGNTSKDVLDGRIALGDYAIAYPKNAPAAALQGSATGTFASIPSAGVVRVTTPAAAGGEIFTVAVFPKGNPTQ